MRVLVLGSGAGGGVPQWNCRCRVCSLAWAEPERVRRRTETSVAVSADGEHWLLLDAAPELREQIVASPLLHPPGPGRGSPIAAVALTSGEVDHVAGLLCLREGHAFTLLATAPSLDNLAASPVFDVLRPDLVRRHRLTLEESVSVAGLVLTAFAVPGKVPLYREGAAVSVGETTEDVVGFEVSDGRRRIAYLPGVAAIPPTLARRLGDSDLLLLDGTTFTDDELIVAELSAKTAGRMGHLPMIGPGGSLELWAGTGARARKIYLHMNNTNPVLIEDSPERAAVEAAGWTIAHDGLELIL